MAFDQRFEPLAQYGLERGTRMWKEFRDFAIKGNVVDLAVGIIIGAAFTAIVTSLVTDVLMPPLGWVLGGIDFSNYYIDLTHLSARAAEAAGQAPDALGHDAEAALQREAAQDVFPAGALLEQHVGGERVGALRGHRREHGPEDPLVVPGADDPAVVRLDGLAVRRRRGRV